MNKKVEKDVNPQAGIVEELLELIARGEIEALAVVAIGKNNQTRFGVTSNADTQLALIGGVEVLKNKVVAHVTKTINRSSAGGRF